MHYVQLVDRDGQSSAANWRSPNGQLPKVDEVIEVDGSGACARVTDISPDDETPIRAELLADSTSHSLTPRRPRSAYPGSWVGRMRRPSLSLRGA